MSNLTAEELLRRIVERRHYRSMWGSQYLVKPRLVTQVFGDGMQMIYLTPINTRPQYYVVRIDSKWNTSNYGEGELLIDHLDDIYEEIESEFGQSYEDKYESPTGRERQSVACLVRRQRVLVGSAFAQRSAATNKPSRQGDVMTPGQIWANSARSAGQDSPVLEYALQDRGVLSGNDRDNVTLREEWTLLCKSLNSLEARGGIEPPSKGFAELCIPNLLDSLTERKDYINV